MLKHNRKRNASYAQGGDSFYETLDNALSDPKCFTDYKPKGDVKKIVYPSKKKKKEKLPKCNV